VLGHLQGVVSLMSEKPAMGLRGRRRNVWKIQGCPVAIAIDSNVHLTLRREDEAGTAITMERDASIKKRKSS